MLNIDPVIMAYFGGAVALIVSFFAAYFKGKRTGENKVTQDLLKSDHEILTDLINNKEKVRTDGIKKTNALSGVSWRDINKLRKEGKTSLSEIADALMRGKK